jgi:hypothetical protein
MTPKLEFAYQKAMPIEPNMMRRKSPEKKPMMYALRMPICRASFRNFS